MVTGSATVFVVSDFKASLDYYRDALSFEVKFVYGEPNFYVCFNRGEADIHLMASTHTTRLAGHGAVCLFVNDVDAVHTELVKHGAKVSGQPQDYAYGMRVFNVADLDGNQLTFGMATLG